MLKLIDILNEVTPPAPKPPAPKFPLPFKSGGVNLTGEAAWNKWRRWADINRKDKYIDDVLNTIKRSNYQTTQRQLDVLVKWFTGVRESLLEVKKKRDRCLRIADRKYKKPSAYKSGAAERCRAGKIWKDLKEINEDLNKSNNQDSIKQLFKNIPELSAIGTVEQYTKYLETIFPNSKLEEIVYHGGTLDPKDRGKDSFTGEIGGKHGLYFTGSSGRAKSYTKAGSKDYMSKSKIYSALLNIQNPLDKKIWSKWKFGADTITDEGLKQMKETNSDGIIVTDVFSKYTNIQYNTQYVVLSMDQVHILGSSEDIEGFKKYVSKTINEKLIREKTKETLRTWFKRKGAPGKTGGWVDCNSPIRKKGKITGYKACGRQKGEKRAKYPSCRPTPAKCKSPGKGTKWGKTK